MQPYFIPYAGYFRLFAASDLFVIYDCVQFPRRGWVHRNRLLDASGGERWLTLPLARAARDIRICDLAFRPGAADILLDRIRQVPLLAAAPQQHQVIAPLLDVRGTPVDYLERLLHAICDYLGLHWHVVRSSTMRIPATLRGQARIIEIARRLGATRYVNAPGGRELYQPGPFEAAGMELRFLESYEGPTASIAQRILEEDRQSLSDDIVRSSEAAP